MSTQPVVESLFSNDHFHIVTGMSTRFVGPVNADGTHIQSKCYQMVNNLTGIVEKEGFMIAELIELAGYCTRVITHAHTPEVKEEVTNDSNILTLQ